MSQDYAKSAARHKQQMAKKNHRHLSKWLLIFTLVLSTAFASFLYYLMQVNPDRQRPQSQPSQNEAAATSKPAEPAPKVEQSLPENHYDFYTLLPESEVIAPKVEEYSSKLKPNAQNYAYLLQAGSFRSRTDADRLRAKLILQGLDARLNSVTGKDGKIWHRIIVGPFTSRSKLNHAQDILANANTESMLIKIKQ